MLSPQWAKSSVLRRLIKGALVAINNELIDALKNCGFFPPILLDYISRLIILFFSRWLENISASGMDSNLCDLLTAARATLPRIQIHPSSQWSPAISLCLSLCLWLFFLSVSFPFTLSPLNCLYVRVIFSNIHSPRFIFYIALTSLSRPFSVFLSFYQL